MRSRVFVLAFALVMLLSLTAFAAEKPQYGGTYHGFNGEDWDTLDPAYASGFDAGAMAVKIFDGLVRFDYYSNDVVPSLATDWKISDDRLTYTFKLRKGVKFHNGRTFTAKDVKYSFDRLFDPKVASPGTWAYEMIAGADEALAGKVKGLSGVKVVDDYTVTFQLKYPFGLFLKHLTLPHGLIVPQDVVEKWGDRFSDHAIGTGPWKLTKWEHDNIIVLEANKEYFEGRPYLDRLEYRVIPEDIVAMAEFEKGNLDITPIPTAEYTKWTTHSKWKNYVIKTVDLSTWYLALNHKVKPLDNVKVRKAIAHAIDVKAIIKSLRNNLDTQASGILPPGMDGNLNLQPVEYNPEKAKQLLKEAGYPNGFSIELWTSNKADRVQIAGAFQAYLAQVGIKAEIVKNDWSTFYAATKKGNVPMFMLSWYADYADPYNFIQPLLYSKANKIQMKDPIFDKMIDEMERTSNAKVRYEISKKIVQRVADTQPYVWLWHTNTTYLKQPWIKGELWHQMYDADKMTTTWIDSSLKNKK